MNSSQDFHYVIFQLIACVIHGISPSFLTSRRPAKRGEHRPPIEWILMDLHGQTGGVHSLPVSQCTPPQRISVCQGKFDELEFLEWKSNNHDSTSNATHIMHDTRNQPEFSYFSRAREAG